MRVANRLIVAFGAGCAAFAALRTLRRRDERHALKEDIKSWENEGGQVPQVPPVAPVVTPESSVPPQH